MKQTITILLLCISSVITLAQSGSKSDSKGNGQGTVVRIDGQSAGSWMKGSDDSSPTSSQPTTVNDNVNFYSTPDGIILSISNGANKIKLYALTGQLLFSGELNQGRFLIQTRKGIYFLKINNNSYKVICK